MAYTLKKDGWRKKAVVSKSVCKQLKDMYQSYCGEISAYTQPIKFNEAQKIFYSYLERDNREVQIGYVEDFVTKEIKGFLIMRGNIIEQLYVKPKYRHGGVALMMLNAKLKRNKRYDLVILDGNPALSFWKTLTAGYTASLKYNPDKINDKYPEEKSYFFVV